MAGRGLPPKERHTRASNDVTPERTVAMPTVAAHVLPDDLLPDGDYWHPATLRWWNTWAESPLAAGLPAVDWCELEACAVLHHEFMRKRSFTLASELRLRVAKFGATPEDRLRLKIKVDAPSRPTVANAKAVSSLADRRARLSS